ncbi:hypothetical protein Agub_g2358 [Astrephomene gubernaculifera]|uniref:Protein ENHANCED DISEASE RESISTANCE 2 C-terminal domain-containing protein n=1 Tax=Astrephomene gubernaculifera TaxID=47775 RepID=A0AAD3HIB8_9CHLO|nr:hypothetical protein Agub_g2358 [Astrephomene gubernaculifera]
MATSEYCGPEDSDPVLEETDVYKATSNSDFVIVRRVRLYHSRFTTYHNIEETEDDNKQWILTAQCELQPRNAADIKESCLKYVRPRGQWAITTLVKPKSIGTKCQPVQLYMFTLSWPTRWAAKGYTSFTFGFPTPEEARHWHARLAARLEAIRVEKAAAAAASAGSVPVSSAAPNSSNHPATRGSAAGASSGGVQRNSVGGVSGGGALGLTKSVSAGGKRMSMEGADAGSPFARAVTMEGGRHQRSATALSEPAKRALLYGAASDDPLSSAIDANAATTTTAAASPLQPERSAPAALRTSSKTPVMASASTPSRPPAPPPSQPAPPAATVQLASTRPPPAATAAPSAPTVRLDPAFAPSSSDSDEEEELADGAHHRSQHGSRRVQLANTSRPMGQLPCGRLGGGSGPCRPPRGNTRGDVRHTKQRWVPYKQVNGVAIYHRPQTAGDAEAGVGGEFMVSTVVRGSPRRCLGALTSNCGNTTILGPALRSEVLQKRRAVDEKEIQRIVLQAPGLTGVLCAPREVVVETVFKMDETGPTLVLMFNSCEPPARFVERRAGDLQQQLEEEEMEECQTATVGLRRSWWGQPVMARVRGGYTMAPLEEYSLDNSPEALVTCIMKVDLGGVCGERSWLRLGADLVGWTDAFLDRMLMAVTLLRDEVEQGRFVVQPLSMVASSRVKERERDSVAALDSSLGRVRSMDGGGGSCGFSMAAAAAAAAATAIGAAGGGAGGRRGIQCLLPTGRSGGSTRTSLTAAAGSAAVAAVRDAETSDRPLLVDGGADGAAAADANGAAAASGGADGGNADGSLASAAAAAADGVLAEGAVAGLVPSPFMQQYETMDDVLDRMRRLAFLEPQVWDQLHQPGKDAPFKIRGPTYLKDRKKIPAGYTRFVLGSMDVIQQPPGALHEHVARFLPSIRQSGAPFSLIVHLVIPGTPLLGIVATFVTDRHPSQLGQPPAQPMEEDHDWEPFDFVLHKYMNGSTHTRNHMLKLIPHIADGSWMIKQSVGTTPVILGKQLRTIYYETPQYIEIDIDISANNVASYVTGLVRGATRSLVIDMGFVLEGTTPWELPEALLGTLRLYNLDTRNAKLIDVDNEIPLRPPTVAPLPPKSAPAAAAAAAAATPQTPQQPTAAAPPSAVAAGGTPLPQQPQPPQQQQQPGLLTPGSSMHPPPVSSQQLPGTPVAPSSQQQQQQQQSPLPTPLQTPQRPQQQQQPQQAPRSSNNVSSAAVVVSGSLGGSQTPAGLTPTASTNGLANGGGAGSVHGANSPSQHAAAGIVGGATGSVVTVGNGNGDAATSPAQQQAVPGLLSAGAESPSQPKAATTTTATSAATSTGGATSAGPSSPAPQQHQDSNNISAGGAAAEATPSKR